MNRFWRRTRALAKRAGKIFLALMKKLGRLAWRALQDGFRRLYQFLTSLPPLHRGDILLHGHTHVPACEGTEGILYLNPGSVSIPKNNSWHGYMTLENGLFLWKDLDGNEKMRYQANLD